MAKEKSNSEGKKDYKIGYGKPPHPPFEKGNKFAAKRTDARKRLSYAYLCAMADAFEKSGVSAISAVLDNNPKDFLSLVSILMPKQSEDVTNPLSGLSDDDLEAIVTKAREALDANRGRIDGIGARAGEAQEVQQAQAIPTIQ